MVMLMFRKLFSFLLCGVLLICALIPALTVSADPAYGTITIGTVNAVPGDTVVVPISIENNPGIMAITVSITYDSSALTYQSYQRGFLKDYTVAAHPDRNLIRFVNCENRNRRNNGIMVSLEFKVNENASFDLHPITIEYKAGDFCNWSLDKLMPDIVPGGVNVAFNGSNCRHEKYSKWETAADPSCTEPGISQRYCAKCGHVDRKEIPAVGHEYEANWTVDRPATAETNGIMSRHCIRCDAITDTLTFTLQQAEEEHIANEPLGEIEKTDFVEQLLDDQIPESERQENIDKKKAEEDRQNDSAAPSGDNRGKMEEWVDKITENEDSAVARLLSIFPNPVGLLRLFLAAFLLLLRLLM